MPARKQIVILMALWGELAPAGTAKEKKCARLRFLAQTVGRIVDSANDLSAVELDRCIDTLRADNRSRARQRIRQAHGSTFAHRPEQGRMGHPVPSGVEGQAVAGPSREQLFKIRQLEIELGWAGVPARLEGFLESKYHRWRPQDLSRWQAGKAIESLFAVWARGNIKAKKGAVYPVGVPELRREVARLKRTLPKWLPAEAGSHPELAEGSALAVPIIDPPQLSDQ